MFKKSPQLNLFLNWTDRSHFIASHNIYLRYFLILPSDPRFGFPGWLFPSCFFFSLMISHFFYTCYICRPSHRRFYHPSTITEYCSLWNRFHLVLTLFSSSLISSCSTVLHSGKWAFSHRNIWECNQDRLFRLLGFGGIRLNNDVVTLSCIMQVRIFEFLQRKWRLAGWTLPSRLWQIFSRQGTSRVKLFF